MEKIIRVFPRKTNMTPDDSYAFIGYPPFDLWRPDADEVHISVTFTWDIQRAQELVDAWGQYYERVFIGGPAWVGGADSFCPGFYIKNGVTFMTRGCNNHCPWCLVPEREGKLKELAEFAPGHIIQDNNLLQASRSHLSNVFAMLRSQGRAVTFAGGMDSGLITDEIAEDLRSLKIYQLFLSADCDAALTSLKRAVTKLSFLPRQRLRCYVLLGYNGESMTKALERLEQVWEIGCIPFAQLYQPADHYIEYDSAWRDFCRMWSRPAIMMTSMKNHPRFRKYHS